MLFEPSVVIYVVWSFVEHSLPLGVLVVENAAFATSCEVHWLYIDRCYLLPHCVFCVQM